MLDTLARASLDGAILVGIVWVLTRALPGLSPAARTTLWWCAAAKFVIGLVWTTPIPLPVLPAAANVAPVAQVLPAAGRPPALGSEAALGKPTLSSPAPSPPAPSWTWLLAGAWIAGVGISTGLGARRWLRMRAVIRRSSPAEGAMLESAASVASILGVPRVPVVRLSGEVDSPLLSGLVRPVILLPARRFPKMTGEQQRMALCHELAHLQRRDVWLGIVPAIAERIFFFHPLVRLAVREYVFWREAACDARVITALDTAPQSYGRLLLDLGVTGRAAALTPAGASWSFSNLKRRIVMLRRPATPSLAARVLTVAAVAASMTAIAPFQLTPRAEALKPPRVAAPPAPPVGAPASAVVLTSEPQPTVEDRDEPAAQRNRDDDDDLRFVFFRDDSTTTMSGNSGDMQRARRHRQQGERLLWFVHDGQEFIIRDADVLSAIDSLWEPIGEIGEAQGKIGAQQGELGARQGEIGLKQGAIGAEQAAVGARQGLIGSKQGLLATREARRLTEKERQEIELERQSLDKDMRDLDREMRLLGEKMRQLDQPMRDLGDDMNLLGREMEQLGRKMEEASQKARKEMRALIEKAIRSGAAQRVR